MILKLSPASQQPTLFDTGANAVATLAALFNEASRKQSSRAEVILDYLCQCEVTHA